MSDATSYQTAENDTVQPGKKMLDGTVFAGISPNTGKAMYVTPADAPLTYTFNQAQRYAQQLDANGHKDWRRPTKRELSEIFKNRAAIGGFDESGADEHGWYCSSSRDPLGFVWTQRFSDGSHYQAGVLQSASLRCVR